ncbi:hypothetical protein I551_3543 [Mycobacterium ulcerans str. Harvey]|uniref:Uncharacterized protein n=1 Tax=Mycobacterium ulcerans str. Harvey TaxID=1299332 RepID=A0ABP3AG73_MYCUL|nr:hypothetical protein I551_3543 [Mycobacterium ulcerans str. Harvey]
MSRQTGQALGSTNAKFASTPNGAASGGPIAPCYHAAVNAQTGAFDLLLGDAGPALVGDEYAGATVAQAQLASVSWATARSAAR